MADEAIAVELTMRDLAIIREALIRQREGLDAAVAPFGLMTTWEASSRLGSVQETIKGARCNLKRRNPKYNPAGDSECANEATDEENDRWAAEHPEVDVTAPEPSPDQAETP